MKLTIEGGYPLVGQVQVPADKSITHRALIFNALAEGSARVLARQPGADNASTAEALQALGVGITRKEDGWQVEGVGRVGLRAPKAPLDCGNSGTSMRLLAGLLAGAGVPARLQGDESLSRRPMGRVCRPLRELGADIRGQTEQGKELPPLQVGPGSFRGGSWDLEVASAQLKTALLLAGLASGSAVQVREPSLSRDHSERMLAAMGVAVRSEPGAGGHVVRIPAGAALSACDVNVPGDFSSAAFLLAAALLVEGSDVQIAHVGVNPTRTGLLDVLASLGAAITPAESALVAGEPVGVLHARSVPWSTGATQPQSRPAQVAADLVPRLIDELILVAAIASQAPGGVEVFDAQELRVKESDRITETIRLLQAFGVSATERPDGYRVAGPQRLAPATVDVGADHRLALTAAVLALAAPGTSTLRGFEIADVSYPGFVETLRSLGAHVAEAT